MTIADKKPTWNPDRLDVLALARAGGELGATDSIGRYARLSDAGVPGGADHGVIWRAQAELRGEGARAVPWLHLQANAVLSLTCQRCLQAVETPLEVDRWFRFVADEATAEAEDEDSEEDVLALEPRPSLRELVEDELLMALPLVPMHEECPAPLPLPAQEAAVEPAEDKPSPFAALAKLKR
ncbi:MAG: DUF177 domain-containing protein [Hydrogenophaga sp.]|uniref:YceD family protein n=1 Tax=Hydrogenophaga sp. TaxID=1904254 RepID=UPI002A366747|nr:DUF177 domain-containing protein [Hydrogenophaga sp.]MDX9969614.1 DUF177 domain-containing protein [Hydrogenophaga sp.]